MTAASPPDEVTDTDDMSSRVRSDIDGLAADSVDILAGDTGKRERPLGY